MTCKHYYIRTWVFEDTGQPSGLWSCVDCSLKFEPITQRTAAVGEDTKAWVELTDEDIKAVNAQVSQIPPIDYTTTTYARAIEAKLKQKNGYAEEKNT